MRRISTSSKSRPSQKTPKKRKPQFAKKSVRSRKKSTANPALAGVRPPPPRPPPPRQPKSGENGNLGSLLRQAQAAARLTLERALADLGVTPPQFAVLTLLRAYPGHSGADLARVALLTPQTVGVIIRNLERDGAIRKTPHPVHGRVLQWTLTRRGGTLLEKCRRHVRTLERRLSLGLTAKTQVTVRRWLSGIATDLG